LHETLAVPFSLPIWAGAVKQCLRSDGLLKAERACNDESGIDNRWAWGRFLAADVARFHTLAPMIRFYCSVMDGTGAVERGLRCHAIILGHQVGQPEGASSLSEACLEAQCKGPQTEAEMFMQGFGNVLLLPS
jgi:hypothetical protein